MELSHVAAIVLSCTFPVLLVIAAAGDLLRYLIPNTLSIALATLAIPALLLAGAGISDILWHLLVGFVVLVLTSLLFFRGLFGGGDVKLLAAAAIWIGWPLIVSFILYTAIAGGLIAIVLIAARRLLRNRRPSTEWLAKLLDSTSGLPYATAIAIGGCIIWYRLPIFSTAFPT